MFPLCAHALCSAKETLESAKEKIKDAGADAKEKLKDAGNRSVLIN